MKSKGADLRALLGGDMIVVPGAFDGLTARLVEAAGFPAVYMTGSGTSASKGYPDYGLLTMSEMVENAAILARSVSIPVISDADTGYGNELNVTRTVMEFEARGVAAIHIEDQVSPKRCGHLSGKEVISRAEFQSKIRAAVAARSDPDFLIIARTDARSVLGFDEAIVRANAAIDAGADMAFVEALESRDEIERVPAIVQGPCVLNAVYGGKTPEMTPSQAAELGYRLMIFPGISLLAATTSVEQALEHLKSTGRPPASYTVDPVAFYRRLGADGWDSIRTAAGELA